MEQPLGSNELVYAGADLRLFSRGEADKKSRPNGIFSQNTLETIICLEFFSQPALVLRHF